MFIDLKGSCCANLSLAFFISLWPQGSVETLDPRDNVQFNKKVIMWEEFFKKHSLNEVKPAKPIVSKPGLRELAEAEAALGALSARSG